MTRLAERYLKAREEVGRKQGREELLRRLASMTPEEKDAEVKRLLAESSANHVGERA